MNGLVAVGNHEVKVAHGGQEIEIAIRLVAAPGVVEGVEWPVAVVELGGLIDDEFAKVFVDRGRILLEEALEGGVGKQVVSLGVVLVAIDGALKAATGDDLDFGGLEDIDEGDLVFGRSFGKSLGVEANVSVIGRPGFHLGDVFIGGR